MKKIGISFVVLTILGSVGFGIWKNMLYFTNTFDVKYLFFRAATAGAILGAALGWWFSRGAASGDGVERFQRIALPTILLAAAFPIWAIWSNHALADAQLGVKKVQFVKQESKLTSRVGVMRGTQLLQTDSTLSVNAKGDLFYTYFLDESGKIDRVRSESPLFGQAREGAPIELAVAKGFWGYEIIK